MGTLILCIIFLLAAIAALFKCKKISIILFCIFFIGFVSIGCGVVPDALMQPLRTPFKTLNQLHWKKHNAIVVIGAGKTRLPGTSFISPSVFSYAKLFVAAQTYFACKTASNNCVLILSGGDPQHLGVSEADVYRHALVSIGVEDFDIELESHSNNTYQNTQFTSVMIKAGTYDYVVLITSGMHLKRAMLYFNHFGIYPVPVPSDYPQPKLSIIPLGSNFALTDSAIHELIGIFRLNKLQVADFIK